MINNCSSWLIGVISLCFGILPVFGQVIDSNDWNTSNKNEIDQRRMNFDELPLSFRLYDISIDNFYQELGKTEVEIELPNPNGEFNTYIIRPSKVVDEEVAHLYTIKTYIGHEKNDPTVLIACDISDNGFHASVFDGEETFIIEPLNAFRSKGHLVYSKKDLASDGFLCEVNSDFHIIDEQDEEDNDRSFAPGAKKTFRLGLVTSGEYTSNFGGSPYNATNVLNALASGVNTINPIFLRDLGIELNLVSNTNCIYQNASTDPFDLATGGVTLANQAQAELDNALGSNGYDVGELIARANIGGIAYVGSTCFNASKGKSFSGDFNSTNLWMDVVAHELGHQFGSPHNFSDDCQGNSSASYRYEPGGGSSIMCYASRCGNSNYYINSQVPYFHYRSIHSIVTQNNGGGSCGVTDATGNTGDPVADAKAKITIPKQTPFVLVGDATDSNDPISSLTYEWEQYNGGGPMTNSVPDCSITNSALFRHRSPVSILYRHFPVFSSVRNGNNNNATWEKLPCVARNMIFSFAVRDNNASFGRVDDDRVSVMVDNSGPFNVTAPNGGESLVGNNSYNVTWTENGTSSFCPLVDIVFSSDNAINNYTVIADAVPNNGSYTITVPNVATNNGRIIVMCNIPGNFQSQSTFYDISDARFSISAGAICPNFLTVVGTPVTSGVYNAEITVESEDQLMNSGSVEFYGGSTVELLTGFDAPASTNFKAENQTCL